MSRAVLAAPFFRAICNIAAASALLLCSLQALAQPAARTSIQQLSEATNGSVKISTSRASGTARFLRFAKNQPPATLTAATPAAQAQQFLNVYDAAFGLQNPATELLALPARVDAYGAIHFRYRQIYQGVPVFGASLRLHFDANNILTAANGVIVPDLTLDVNPAFTADQAAQAALNLMANQVNNPALNLAVINNTLYVFNTGLLQDVPERNHLVYEVEVVDETRSVREFLYIDAHSGKKIEQFTGIHNAPDREVSEGSLVDVVWDESNGDPDPIPNPWNGENNQTLIDTWQAEIDGARETYNLFASLTNGGYLSYNGSDATMRTVNNDPFIFCPNASWDGVSANYCEGTATDDVVAHEWGHGYTEYTNSLIYAWQSGALNEAFSDMWGETVDLLNSRGTDAPAPVRTPGACSALGQNAPNATTENSYRWLMGEDASAFGGAIRDLWNPTCYGHPGKISDSEYHCSGSDGGGVHRNSGIPNHLFALLADGGSYNAINVSAIGLTKAAHIHWQAQSNYLHQVSNFSDYADAIEQACTDLLGINLFALTTADTGWGNPSGETLSQADCTAVSNALSAVEVRQEPVQCGFTEVLSENAPPLCNGPAIAQTILMSDWESGLGSWTVGTHSVANPPDFNVPNWALLNDLPNGALPGSTQAVFAENSATDPLDCFFGVDESGVRYLQSPSIALPGNISAPRIAFDHLFASEAGWDGGNLKISVNSGSWTLIPASAFAFNPYNDTLFTLVDDSSTNPLQGEAAFTGPALGDVSSGWGQSQIDLSGIAGAGDTIQLRFELGIDQCVGVYGWIVDDVRVYSCEAIQNNILIDSFETP